MALDLYTTSNFATINIDIESSKFFDVTIKARYHAVPVLAKEITIVALLILRTGMAAVGTVVKLPFQAAHLVFKNNATLKNIHNNWWGASVFANCAIEGAKYALASLSTFTLGIIFNPSLNIRVHVKLGITNEKELKSSIRDLKKSISHAKKTKEKEKQAFQSGGTPSSETTPLATKI